MPMHAHTVMREHAAHAHACTTAHASSAAAPGVFAWRAHIAARPADVEVPGARIIRDAEELQLIGRGLPIVQGVSEHTVWTQQG